MNNNLEQREILRAQRLAAEAAAHRDRRERIATAAMQGLLAYGPYGRFSDFVEDAVAYADALIAELDKPKEVKS